MLGREAFLGPRQAWNGGFRRVQLELDSLTLVNLISGKNGNQSVKPFLNQIWDILNGEWIVRSTIFGNRKIVC